jgi:hypothetical protein
MRYSALAAWNNQVRFWTSALGPQKGEAELPQFRRPCRHQGEGRHGPSARRMSSPSSSLAAATGTNCRWPATQLHRPGRLPDRHPVVPAPVHADPAMSFFLYDGACHTDRAGVFTADRPSRSTSSTTCGCRRTARTGACWRRRRDRILVPIARISSPTS